MIELSFNELWDGLNLHEQAPNTVSPLADSAASGGIPAIEKLFESFTDVYKRPSLYAVFLKFLLSQNISGQSQSQSQKSEPAPLVCKSNSFCESIASSAPELFKLFVIVSVGFDRLESAIEAIECIGSGTSTTAIESCGFGFVRSCSTL